MKRKPLPGDISDDEWGFAVPYLTLLTEDTPQQRVRLALSADAGGPPSSLCITVRRGHCRAEPFTRISTPEVFTSYSNPKGNADTG
jgi:hypothetical protein